MQQRRKRLEDASKRWFAGETATKNEVEEFVKDGYSAAFVAKCVRGEPPLHWRRKWAPK